MLKKALTIAGSDSGGGAGIQADLKTFSALGVYGLSVITSITAQNTTGVIAVEDISPAMVAKQIDAVFSDIQIDAVKIGMVSNREIIKVIVEELRKWDVKNIVLDPVMMSESGSKLLDVEARSTLIKELIPLADIITPNLSEASVLLERDVITLKDMEKAVEELTKMGCSSVLLKGGHLTDRTLAKMTTKAIDVYYDGQSLLRYQADRVKTRNIHGTGCTYSSAIAAYLAFGFKMDRSIARAKDYITGAIQNSFNIGEGAGPTNHFYNLWKEKGE
ncbi:bifunctional hydroxymethylpyrimidine kinase/phosphomethylpyrimidine kinase [Halocella sp. SP3-1]|uniref:bifunctional hydroxymethylpyrimidine kinase/phosphomethylpyrimidine kinase n=1 Tax=Halocella sp. SP3-1 TaxID=2382161 RepID=UPI000F74CA32|nr:bifunctional hydroxymethylpyrimidine kinase/phosphomethylpyrimidine kinase [Halocella sp. SP3-1]AZO93626.1 bifunctional hydroxymethylpyrimidine kinase/phosphomethylpyrimidine kinase [Halocella sp. SP3-1]